jgi:hypothetical protein
MNPYVEALKNETKISPEKQQESEAVAIKFLCGNALLVSLLTFMI